MKMTKNMLLVLVAVSFAGICDASAGKAAKAKNTMRLDTYKRIKAKLNKLISQYKDASTDKEMMDLQARINADFKLLNDGNPESKRQKEIKVIEKSWAEAQATKRSYTGSAGTGSATAATATQTSQEDGFLDQIAEKVAEIEEYLEAAQGEGVERGDKQAIYDEINEAMKDYQAIVKAASLDVKTIFARRPSLEKRIKGMLDGMQTLEIELRILSKKSASTTGGTIATGTPTTGEEDSGEKSTGEEA